MSACRCGVMVWDAGLGEWKPERDSYGKTEEDYRQERKERQRRFLREYREPEPFVEVPVEYIELRRSVK